MSGRIKNSLRYAAIVFALAWPVATCTLTQTVSAKQPVPEGTGSSTKQKCTTRILTFPAWYDGLVDGNCSFTPIKQTTAGDTDKADIVKTATRIGLNVVEFLLQLVGYAAVVMLIIGGFNYMTSQGDSNKMSSAKNTVLNAVIGLIISILSVAIVNIVAGAIK